MNSTCSESSRLHQYLSGELSDVEGVVVESHLQSCEFCQHILGEALRSSEGGTCMGTAGALDSPLSGLDTDAKRQLLSLAAFGGDDSVVVRELSGQSLILPCALPARYVPVRRLGAGGMGQVWEVYDSVVGRSLAIKFLPSAGGGLQSLQRLLKEASLLGALRHPGIVQIYEVLTDTATPAIVMELISGPSLQVFLAGGSATERIIASFVAELCEAVQYAHEQRIVHRDLKPSNILLRSRSGVPAALAARDLAMWQPVITDFGTGRMVGDQTITMAGQIVGTPAYMAPEQALGTEEGKESAVDIYGLGVVLYELLVGRPPYLADSPLVLLDLVKRGDPASPRLLRADLSPDLENICLKCLSAAPSDRYSEARQLREDLLAFLEGRTVTARRISWPVRTFRWCRRNRRTALLLSSLVAALVLITVQSLYFGFSQRDLLDRANRLEAASNRNWQLSEDRALQLESSLKSAIDVAEQLMALTETQVTQDPGWLARRQQIRQQAVQAYTAYVRHFCPTGLISVAHFRVACALCSLRWQLSSESVVQAEINQLVDSWNAFPESFRCEGESLELRAAIYYVETEFYRRQRDYLRAGQGFLEWAEILQRRASQHADGSSSSLNALRVSTGMLQNASAEFRQAGRHVEAARVSESACGVLQHVMDRAPGEDRDLLNYLVHSQLAAENWRLAGNATAARSFAERGLLKLAERPVHDEGAMPLADRSKKILEALLQDQEAGL